MSDDYQLAFGTYTFPNKTFKLSEHRLDIDTPSADIRRKDGGVTLKGYLKQRRWRINGKIYGTDEGTVHNDLNTLLRAVHNEGIGASFFYRSDRYAFASLAPGGVAAMPDEGLYRFLYNVDISLISEPFAESVTRKTYLPNMALNGRFEKWPVVDLLTDGALEVWANPTTLTNWTEQGDGVYALAQETTIKHGGTYSAKLTGGTSYHRIIQTDATSPANNTFVMSAWAWSATPNKVQLQIEADGGTTAVQSSFHPGDSEWHYLTAVITCSGTATTVYYECVSLTGATAYFDDVRGYAMVAPTGFSYAGAGATLAREEGTVYSGTYSSRFSGNSVNFYQDIQNAGGHNLAYWKGRTITLSCRVWCATASRAIISIYDGVAETFSSYHTGDSTWQLLTVTKTISNSATLVTLNNEILGGSAVAYFDDIEFIDGTTSTGVIDAPLDNTLIESITPGGNYPVGPLFTFIPGASFMSTLSVENLANSHMFSYSGPLLSGQTLLIDAAAGSVLLHVGATMIDSLSYFSGDLNFLLEPGIENQLVVSGPTMFFGCDFRDRYYV